jgi:hypothetical protein
LHEPHNGTCQQAPDYKKRSNVVIQRLKNITSLSLNLLKSSFPCPADVWVVTVGDIVIVASKVWVVVESDSVTDDESELDPPPTVVQVEIESVLDPSTEVLEATRLRVVGREMDGS